MYHRFSIISFTNKNLTHWKIVDKLIPPFNPKNIHSVRQDIIFDLLLQKWETLYNFISHTLKQQTKWIFHWYMLVKFI